MDTTELALIELLDHLGRQASRWRIPAPRKADSVAEWCGRSAEAERALRDFLGARYPGSELGDLATRVVSFEGLVRSLLRG